MLHRDIKTANLLVGEQMTLKLTDFGFAKLKANWSRPRVLTRRAGVLRAACWVEYRSRSGPPCSPPCGKSGAGTGTHAASAVPTGRLGDGRSGGAQHRTACRAGGRRGCRRSDRETAAVGTTSYMAPEVIAQVVACPWGSAW